MTRREIGDYIVPNQTSEMVLSSRNRPVSSLLVYPLALCTVTRHTQVGQEGICKTDRMQVCTCVEPLVATGLYHFPGR